MSGSGVDIVRSMYAGFSELAEGADVEAYVREHFDPAVEYRPVEELEPIRGHEALIEWNRRWFEAWDEFRANVDELIEAEDTIVTEISIQGRGGESGAAVEMRVFHLFELRDGRIVQMNEFLVRDLALEAARRP